MEASVPSTTGQQRPPLTPEERAARNQRRKAARAARRAAGGAATLPGDLTAMVLQPGQRRPQRGVSLVAIPRGQQLLVGRGAYDYRAGGRAVGADLGGMAGEAMGAVVSKLLGRGAYTLRKNSIMRSSTQMPRMSARPDGGFEITSREFILDVVASGSLPWSITNTLNLNPGLASVFTFASQLAVAFEEWEADAFVVVYEPASGSVSTTQALGAIQLATQYDLQDAAFGSQTEMLDYEFSTTNRPDFPMIHPVECDPRQNQLARFYTRSGLLANTTSTVDARYNAYDIGRLIVAQAGVPAAAGTVLGKLFFSYTMKFFKPKLYGGLASYNLLHDFFSASCTVTSGTVSAIIVLPLSGNSTLGGTTGTGATSISYLFPPSMQIGNFLIVFNAAPSGTVAFQSTTPNFTLVNAVNAGVSYDSIATGTGGLTGGGVCTQRVTLTGANAGFTMSFPSTTGTITGTGTIGMAFQVIQVFGGGD